MSLLESSLYEVSRLFLAPVLVLILALVAASITFFVLTIRRRWLLQELRNIELAKA